MSLVTYEETRPWARSIKQKVAAREMPPFYIDRNVGIQHFSNDTSLTDAQIATIVKWVDGGAPKGDPADMPPPRQFLNEDRWQFGKYGEPDVVVTLPQDYQMPATGPDHWPDIVVDPKLTEDRYLAAVQLIPTKGYQAIHHMRSSLIPAAGVSGSGGARQSETEMGRFLNEYAIGKGADLFPEGSGRLIKAGTRISIGLHMHPNYGSKEATAVNVALGLKFHPRGYIPKHVVLSDQAKYPGIEIAPGDANARVDGYFILPKPTRLLSYQPHMHNRGKAACIMAIIPMATGESEEGLTSKQPGFETLSCAGFSFNWHLNYVYADDSAPLLPAGTMLQTIQWYDNSKDNRTNPDPDAFITRGQRTLDEMAGAWLSFYEMSEDEFQRQLAARGARNYSVPTQRSQPR
jgi:hypothetical protein